MNAALTLGLTTVAVVVPILLIVGLWRKRSASKVDWLLTAALTTGFVGYVLLAGRWDISTYYLRPLLALAYGVAMIISLIKVWRAPWWSRPTGAGGWVGLVTNGVVGAAFLALFGLAISGVTPRQPAVELSMPLRDGVSYVGQGGAATIMNYHHANRAQAFAVDVVGLTPAGRNASGLAPGDPSRYAIWGRSVHSPCPGTVLEARGDLADLQPPATDRDNLAGNHVLIRCAGTDPAVDVLLAHLQQGSVNVAKGAVLADGQVIGRVGNTGNTTEPHLHVHAIRTGSGTPLRGDAVPIRFDGRFLLRNDLVVGS